MVSSLVSLFGRKELPIMKDNRVDELCELCGSQLIRVEENDDSHIECSYCGASPKDLDLDVNLYE